jgi:peptidyl-prolyl cis-trans isomerase D
MDPSLEKIVVTLKQPGEISEPTQTKYGFSIIKLLEVEKPEVIPFPKVRSEVEKALSRQKAEQAFADEADKLSNLTYANPTSLSVAAKTLDLPIKTTELFDRQGSKESIASNPKVLAAAFSLDVLQGNNSSVIELNPETLIVLRVKEHKPATVQPFAEVRKQIEKQLGAQLVEQKAQRFGEDLLKKLRQGETGQQVAKQAKLVWKVVNGAGRYGTQAPTAIINAAFHMPRPQEQKASSTGLQLPNGDYALLTVNAVHDGVMENAENKKQHIFGEEIENANGRLDYGLYVDALVKKAKVVVNQPKN